MPAGTWRPKARPFDDRALPGSTCAAASTGSNCTARWTTTARPPLCPSCWPPCAAATPWCAWAMAPSACCPRSGWNASRRWPAWAPRTRTRTTCASGATRRACWMRCWRPSPRCASTRCSSASANACAPSPASRRRPNRQASWDNCATTSAKASAGWNSSASSGSDRKFQRVRERMRAFTGVKTAAQPPGFVGQLRDYQCEGLGWMEFLREFGFGGCLADDMGVGKTAQVLAVLESRRTEGRGPSLVVAPKSLMFNWRAESQRFTPQLRVLEHTGLARDTALISQHDLILTTYGTLLRDAAQLSQIAFDYVVLDEAQAVKNSATASAKAVRLLRGAHRLALSGTPVENHLGELWSLFEFLNPGMLGEARVLNMAGGLARNPGEDARRILAHALRPFILRRTKQQVARELPEKTEQTIFCELEGPQRKQYRSEEHTSELQS